MTSVTGKAVNAAKAFMLLNFPDRRWFIVGGLLRDDYLDKPFKDIDVFIVGYSTDPQPDVDLGAHNAHLYYAETRYFEGFQINLIFMRGDHWSLETMTERCDFGICQIGYCPVEDRVYITDDFKFDATYKILTQCRDTVPSRLTRMQDKFSDFVYYNPSGFELNYTKWSYDKEDGEVKEE